MNSQRLFLLFLLLTTSQLSYSQETIPLINPSFEDEPRAGGMGFPMSIEGWIDVGRINFPGETAPDIHGAYTNYWKVTTQPYDGETFLSLVTRPNGSYESVAQLLKTELEANETYSLSVYLSQDPGYASGIQQEPGPRPVKVELIPFSYPIILRIWHLKDFKHHKLLAESTKVDHREWREYTFDFTPEEDVFYLGIEAYFPSELEMNKAGHLLIDKMSLTKH